MTTISESDNIDAIQFHDLSGAFTAPDAGFTRLFSMGGELYIIAPGGAVTKLTDTGPIELPDGSIASPALFFTADTNVGMYRVSADLAAMVAGGKVILQWINTGTQSNLIVGDGTQSANNLINGAAAVTRDVTWQSNGVARWNLRASNTAETGGNVGSDLQLLSRADDGSSLATIFHVKRSSGRIGFGTTSLSAKVHIAGTTNEIQQIVQGHSTQAQNLREDRNSAGTILNSVPAAGGIRLHSDPAAGLAATITMTNDVAGTPANAITPTSWLKVYDGATARYIPLYT